MSITREGPTDRIARRMRAADGGSAARTPRRLRTASALGLAGALGLGALAGAFGVAGPAAAQDGPPAEVSPATEAPPIDSPENVEFLANKHNPVGADFAPTDLVRMADLGAPSANDHSLRQPAADAVQAMFAAAEADGIELDMTSGYRSYETQERLYTGYVEELGQAGAGATSARPGFSEHQTGLAADISSPNTPDGCVLEQCFEDTPEWAWLNEHAWEYGFILRYPEGATDVTGYEYEPWHFRYIGAERAAEFRASGAVTYEEFLGVEPAPDYR